MPLLERITKAFAVPRRTRRAAGFSDSVVVVSGTGVLITARVGRDAGAGGLTFVVIEGGVIHAASR